MNPIEYLLLHPWLISVGKYAAIWIFKDVITALVSAMPAPGKDSSAKYSYWFKFLNSFTGNVLRAQSTALEKSPNWQDAVNLHLEKLGVIELNPTEEKK
jgi:hypothetical protein